MEDQSDSYSVEERRQRTIRDYRLDQEGAEPEFDALTELAADLFDVPISAVSVLAPDLQLFQGVCGLPERTTRREEAFCNVTVERNDVLVVEDAAKDPRFRDNPLVTGEPFIRFYAGAPLKIGSGVAVGSLCLIDRKPRKLSDEDRRRLLLLARTVSDVMELRLGSRLADERQHELERQAELLRATVDHVQQGIGVFDRELRLVLWNQQLMDMLGIPEALCHSGCDAAKVLLAAARNGAFGPGDPEEIVEGLLLSIRTTPSRRLELLGPGGRILLAWRASIPDGRSILTIQDITEQRRVARMKDEFVSTVSHELRTPLTSIAGALAILGRKSQGALDPASAKMLEMATRNADRLSALINDILDIEKLGSGTLAMRRDRLDLAQVLRDAIDHNQPYADRHQVQLRFDPAEPPHLPVLGDAGRLLQAFTNLISNACKFSPAGSVVCLEAARQLGDAMIRVVDQGSGIPDDFRPHMFRRFAQADPSNKNSKAVGTGLGLAITKAIVERHEGEIGFTSEVGQGTCFWIRLPLLSEAAQ